MEELVQEIAVNTGTPVPLRLTEVLAPVEELLVRVSWPVADPAAVGSNCTVSVAVGLDELRVSGKVTPEMVKPAPVMLAELTVTDAVPVEVKVRVCVVAVPTETLPKVRLVALTVKVGVPAVKTRAKVSVTLPALAVNVAVCEVETDETVAVKLPVVEPAATVTDEGTLTAELLLDRLTT
jgi:hypothetical protein